MVLASALKQRKAIGALAVAVSLTVAASALASASHLREARSLKPAASSAAGKRVSVFCAATRADMAAVSGVASAPLGFTAYPGAPRFDLSPQVCGPLADWLASRSVDVYQVAFAILVLAHEAQHSRGIWDETDATCKALGLMPALVRRYFPPHGRATVREMLDDARAARLALGDAYNAHPC